MFAERLKILRKKAGYSQQHLADIMQVTQQAVGKWETGRSAPDLEGLNILSRHFNVTTDYLLGNEQENVSYSNLSDSLIPILGTVKAGFGAYAFEEDYGSEPANVKNPDEYFYLIVKGDSMEPQIRDGDLALIHKQPTLQNGDLGVFVYGDGEGTLKKYIKQGNTIILQPFNNNYDPQIISGEELNNLYIAGKVNETKSKW